MQKGAVPIKSIYAIFFLVIISMFLTIYAISEYDSYAYDIHTVEFKNNWIKVYSDAGDNGNSWSQEFEKDNIAGFDCEIKPGHDHPYCIMLNWITANEFQGIDLSEYSFMKIYGQYNSPSELDFLRISLRHFDAGYSQMYQNHTYKYNLIEIKRKDLADVITIDFDKLSVPFWWLSLMKGNKVNSYVDISNIPLIEIATGTHASFGNHSFRGEKFEFYKEIITKAKLYEYILFYWTAFIFLLLTIMSIYFSLVIVSKSKDEKHLIQLNQALSRRSSELEIFNKTDELTGVLNRAGMHNKMMSCISNNTLPITVVMVDVDHFKKINDNFGHQSGDRVLEILGEILNNFVIDEESVSRFGGEEFMILMPNKTTEQIIDRLEKLRIVIENTDMHLGKPITASMGVACAHHKIEFKKLIERADNALYIAKNNGRNCIKEEEK